MVDAGRVHPARYHGWSNHNDNDLQGSLREGIINGIYISDAADGAHDTWTVMPPRFPILSVRRDDVPYSEHCIQNVRHDTNEYWSLHHAAFQQAMSALALAYTEFQLLERPKGCLLYSNKNGYIDATMYDLIFCSVELGLRSNRKWRTLSPV